MKPTIYDIAKEAGVSGATVSKVLNNTGRISEKTRNLVLNIAEKLNYQPNLMASALNGKSIFTIGLIVPDLSNPFFALVARKIEDRGHELGYNLVICSSDYIRTKEEKYISLLLNKKVDGIILMSGFEDISLVKALVLQDVPFVVVGRDIPSLDVNVVSIDNFLGGYLATSHLIEQGHTNIGFVGLDVWSNRERYKGYIKALSENGINVCENTVYAKETSIISGRKITAKLFDSQQNLTAIFACNDLLAVGVLEEARAKGKEVPKDLSIVGFDDTVWAQTSYPKLTTIAQPTDKIGKKVMDLLVLQIEDKINRKQQIILKPELILRESTTRNK
ncbi:LacI family DNA-binding transcriptional regulator [Priestia megaterium]|uniref:LacI family DNA-binding transcriptional regulator n=1 Tax=Priestia megaterium TaxID=1404 RepID=UPI003A806D66